ncbi:hypothetical protein HHK36_023649 [Tetracentron sinense]|uniref:Pyrroline-5-carboxylate reductase n=1 Tax=Tetracentron sinense TaxID=13715 RepID=A0A834YP42_TETSI|nr:hypothetical protein HHK36_023649 [Tetracentron sinense]
MADEFQEDQTISNTPLTSCLFLKRLMTKKRTWVSLFVLVYAVLLYFSWNLLQSILASYNSNASSSALYASVLFGSVFGLLSLAAALAVAVPATIVTWITVLVLLAFFGKSRRVLVLEGRKITADITGFAFKIVLKEGNIVAMVCAIVGYFTLLRRSGEDD